MRIDRQETLIERLRASKSPMLDAAIAFLVDMREFQDSSELHWQRLLNDKGRLTG